jgi:GAF domain
MAKKSSALGHARSGILSCIYTLRRKICLFQCGVGKAKAILPKVWDESGAAGRGHVGFAFANNRPIITEDSRNPDVKNLVSASEDHSRDYDESVYISFASIPIGPVKDQQEPLGVLVATSDRPQRFSSENSRIIAHAALALANALTVMAPSTGESLSSIIEKSR